jgi:hypothetical protein
MSKNHPTRKLEGVEVKLHAVLHGTIKVNSFNFRMIRCAVKGILCNRFPWGIDWMGL